MSGLIVLLAAEIFFLLLAFLLSGKDIMAPSVVMCLMFVLSTLVATLNAKRWGIDYSAEAAAILSTGLLAFIAGEAFFRYFFCGQLRGRSVPAKASRFTYVTRAWALNVLILVNATICAVQLMNVIRAVGFSAAGLGEYFAAYRRMGISNLSESGQYMLQGVMNQLIKIVEASGYVASYLLANRLVNKDGKTSETIKLGILMVLAVFPSIMSAGRTGILRLLSACVIEYYIAWHQKNGWNRNLSWRYFRYGVVGLLVAIPAFYSMLDLVGRTTERGMLDYISGYLGGSIQMFNLYVRDPVKRKILGEESLFSVLKVLHFLGLSEASTSYNLEFRSLNVERCNVYTFFRRPLHDFGLWGMYGFTILIAFFFAWIYFKKIKCREKSRCEFWVLLYGYLFFWIIVSSIDQYSIVYISAATVIMTAIIYALFRMLVRSPDEKRKRNLIREEEKP